jgi:branched-chain amino acid transport system substrate-binding protein
MSRKVVPLLVIGLVLAMVLGACAPKATPAPTQPPAAATTAPTQPPAAATTAPTQPPAAETKVLKIGVQGPFSGPAARTGEEFKGSVQMTLDEINGQVGNYKIEVVWIDCQSDPAKGAQAYEQAAVQDQIQAGVLNWHSSVAVSIMDVAAKHKIPHFFGFGATEVVNEKFTSDPEKYSYWMIKGWPAPAKLSISYVQALEDAISKGIWKPAEKTVAIYGEDTDWGRSFGGAIKKQLQDAGWKVVAEEYFPIEQTEFYPILNKFKELNPALVAGTSTAAPVASAFIKQADEVGLKSLIIMDGLGWVGEWYQLTGKASDYVLDQIPGWTTPKAKEFAEKFKARFGIEPSPSAAGLAYDGMHLFVEVLKNTLAQYGELNRETIYKWARENIHTGKWSYKDGIIMKEYKYTPETIPDPVVGQGYYIFPVLQYFDGVGKVIFPPEWAEQPLKPKP